MRRRYQRPRTITGAMASLMATAPDCLTYAAAQARPAALSAPGPAGVHRDAQSGSAALLRDRGQPTAQIRVAVGAARASERARRLEVRRYQLVRSLDGWGCGASSLAYIW